MIIVTSSSSKNSDFQKFSSTLTRKAGVIKYGKPNRILRHRHLFKNGCQFKILLYAFKLASLNPFGDKNSFELSTQKRG